MTQENWCTVRKSEPDSQRAANLFNKLAAILYGTGSHATSDKSDINLSQDDIPDMLGQIGDEGG